MSGRYEEEPRGSAILRSTLIVAVALAAFPAASWVGTSFSPDPTAIVQAKCFALMAGMLSIAVWELFARFILLDRAEGRANGYDSKRRDEALADLPRLGRSQSGRHIALAALAALSIVAGLEAMQQAAMLSYATIFFGVIGILFVVGSQLFPIERYIAKAFSNFKHHLEETLRGNLIGVGAPVRSEIIIDHNDHEEEPRRRRSGGVFSSLLYALLVVIVTGAALFGGYFGLQVLCSDTGFFCQAAINAKALSSGIDIP